jgi:hypothetical protein
MCFAFDFKQNKWLVIDGLQRISTIIRFLKGDDWKLSSLEDIDPALAGKNAATIKTSKGQIHQYFVRVENQTLPINVLRCDFTKQKHNDYIFTIFHRLNSGGAKLTNQEIRNCIYGGPFNNLLKSLDSYPAWRHINNMADGASYRFAKQELILRFFAFFDQSEKYKGQISKFLNDYMFAHKNATPKFLDQRKKLFEDTITVVRDKIFPDALPTRLPMTVLEALLVGVAWNLDALNVEPATAVRQKYEQLRADPNFLDASLAEGLAKKDKVDARLAAAKNIFGQ